MDTQRPTLRILLLLHTLFPDGYTRGPPAMAGYPEGRSTRSSYSAPCFPHRWAPSPGALISGVALGLKLHRSAREARRYKPSKVPPPRTAVDFRGTQRAVRGVGSNVGEEIAGIEPMGSRSEDRARPQASQEPALHQWLTRGGSHLRLAVGLRPIPASVVRIYACRRCA